MAELSIAIADDNRQTLNLLGEILEKEDGIHVVGKADNGEDAYNMIVRTNPDIVLMDVIMPRLDGISVMEKIKNNTQMKNNIVFLLILIPIIWISCDGMGHQTIDFRKIENLMPQHPDSALMLLEQIENKENLSRKDKAHYYLLLTEAQDKTFVKHETDSLITIATDYYEETDDLERKAKAWY